MTKIIFGLTMSLDGFINDTNGSVAMLFPDHKELEQSYMMQEAIRTTGAVVMGRRTFDMASDPDAYADFYEFQVPIFVITKQAPERKPKENGRISFTFVDSVDVAIQQAKLAAGEKNVTVVGGPNIGKQLLKAGLVDELEVGIMPILIGKGQRLSEVFEDMKLMLKKNKIFETGQRTDISFTVQK